jgi:WD repeat-containing protein 48
VFSAQSKLTASRFLRVRKLTTHVRLLLLFDIRLCVNILSDQVQDKLERLSGTSVGTVGTPRTSIDSQTSLARSTRPRAEDLYEILCGDVVLPLDMTLAVVRQYVWRQAAELIMYYRRKTVGKSRN